MSHSSNFLSFIPESLPSQYLKTADSFSRNSKLTIPETIAFVCGLVSGGQKGGLRPNLANFLLNNVNQKTIDVSNICRTRYKIKSTAFEKIFQEVVDFAYKHWDSSEYQFAGRNVIAVDGSKCKLPASKELQKAYDRQSLSLVTGGHHYPECLVTTFYDVFRKIPVYRTVRSICKSSERDELLKSLDNIPENSIIYVDRGYYGYEVFSQIKNSTHDIVARIPASGSFKVVQEFVKSDKNEDVVTINPTNHFQRKVRNGGGSVADAQPIKMRLIRYTPVDGTEEIVLATTLLDTEKYPSEKLQKMYWDRWQVELFYRDEKCYVEASKFHSKKVEGVLQEVFASVLMSVVTRYHLYKEKLKSANKNKTLPQYLTAINTFSSRLITLISLPKEKAIQFYHRIIQIIKCSGYYCQENRKSYPRVNKGVPNKWKRKRAKKLE